MHCLQLRPLPTLLPMPEGLRAQKKADTRRRLAAIALELAAARGLHGFTVADVAAEAGVSARTFFNYFRTKEEALFRYDEEELAAFAAALVARPADEHPVMALVATVTPSEDRAADVIGTWRLRQRLVEREPALLPHHLAAIAELEHRLTEAMAERLGSAPDDPFPVVVVSAVMGTVRATLGWWEAAGRPRPVLDIAGEVMAHLEAGFRR